MFKLGWNTDPGLKRSRNEDALFVSKLDYDKGVMSAIKPNEEVDLKDNELLVCIVADGMGGTDKGDYASNKAIDLFHEKLSVQSKSVKDLRQSIVNFFIEVNNILYREQLQNVEEGSFGTTLTVCLLDKEVLDVYWIGDSRVYLLHEGELTLGLGEHTLVWNEYLKGNLKYEEIRTHPQAHVITKCIGLSADKTIPERKVHDLVSGLQILVCSDGINCMLDDKEIRRILMANKDDLQGCADQLIEQANELGGVDNSTAIVVKLGKVESKKALPPPNNSKGLSKWLAALLIAFLVVGGIYLFSTKYDLRSHSINEQTNSMETPETVDLEVSDSTNTLTEDDQQCFKTWDENFYEYLKDQATFENHHDKIRSNLEETKNCLSMIKGNDEILAPVLAEISQVLIKHIQYDGAKANFEEIKSILSNIY